MKLLFFDVDGVVWTIGGCILARHNAGKERASRHELDPVALAIAGELIEEMDLRVVVSSSWRLGNSVESLREILGPKIGPRIIGVTPHLPGEERGREIDKFLKSWNEHYRGGPVDDFVILDDDRDMNPHMGHLFWTDSYAGITVRDTDKVKRYLKSGPIGKKLIRLKKTVLYNLDREFWGIVRKLSYARRSFIRRLLDKE